MLDGACTERQQSESDNSQLISGCNDAIHHSVPLGGGPEHQANLVSFALSATVNGRSGSPQKLAALRFVVRVAAMLSLPRDYGRRIWQRTRFVAQPQTDKPATVVGPVGEAHAIAIAGVEPSGRSTRLRLSPPRLLEGVERAFHQPLGVLEAPRQEATRGTLQ
jgi:hypothetical protein